LSDFKKRPLPTTPESGKAAKNKETEKNNDDVKDDNTEENFDTENPKSTISNKDATKTRGRLGSSDLEDGDITSPNNDGNNGSIIEEHHKDEEDNNLITKEAMPIATHRPLPSNKTPKVDETTDKSRSPNKQGEETLSNEEKLPPPPSKDAKEVAVHVRRQTLENLKMRKLPPRPPASPVQAATGGRQWRVSVIDNS